MATMRNRALRLTGWGAPPRLVEVPRPRPGPGEVLLRVDAAGICHSDLHLLDAPPGAFGYRLPFTLGHEIAGTVAETGAGVTDIAAGERVVVYGPWGCGRCGRCALGQDNYCDNRATLGWSGVGLGRDGGLADHVLIPDVRHLVPIGDLDPTQAAPLADAGLTPFHALSGLPPNIETVGVVGVGGLGHLAVSLLRATTGARVFAVDVREDALALAHRLGAAVTTAARADTPAVLRGRNGGVGLDAVLDFVGTDDSLAMAAASLRAGGDLVVVGSGGGALTVRKPGALPAGARITLPYWGTRAELADVIALARSGALPVATELFPLSDAVAAIDRVRAGTVLGRAVLTPD